MVLMKDRFEKLNLYVVICRLTIKWIDTECKTYKYRDKETKKKILKAKEKGDGDKNKMEETTQNMTVYNKPKYMNNCIINEPSTPVKR